ncbi:MAG: universal stress protein [Deltaproteobacteria bacterium]|nr:universal stress protein [Deltaproteobacteria bacterium]
MIKKILVAQDGSVYSKSAFEYGVWLSRRFEASLAAIHVVDIVSLEGPFLHDLSGSLGFEPYVNFSSKMKEVLEAKGKEILSSFEEDCKKAGVECTTGVAYGIVPNEICSKANLADLVILGRRGINARFEYGMLGSTTESVLRSSPKPVLVVPEGFTEPKNPMLAYDGSPNASRAMHYAAEWSKTLSLPLTVVTVSGAEDGDTILKNAQDYIKPYGVDAKLVRLKNDPPVEIERYYRENGHDLLFMGTSHHSKLVEMVLGSTTEHVMRTVGGPFFLAR